MLKTLLILCMLQNLNCLFAMEMYCILIALIIITIHTSPSVYSNTASKDLNLFFPKPFACLNLAERYSFQCLSLDHYAYSKAVFQCMIANRQISLFFSMVLAAMNLQTIFKKLDFL